jgi:predicted MFS family arabinose efflux permease
MARSDQQSRASKDETASPWAPFRSRWFAAMWSAQYVSNVGGWMQTVAAQWLILTLTSSATYVALVQTASSLPVVLFALLAGAAGDLVDRRRFLLFTQTLMLLAATALGALAIAGLVTPWLLLALIFAVGSGQALTAPTWQTLQPELVPPEERQQAISFGAVNQNLARAVGPAIGGVLLAATSAGTVFLVNAATFLAVIFVIALWRGTRPASSLPPEHLGEAIRAGTRYVSASPALRVILLRAGVFTFFVSSIWALLPIVARSQLHLGSGGYGLLLACVGVGAVAGAALLPQLRGKLSATALLGLGSIGMAGVAAVLGYVHVAWIVGAALAFAGLAWIFALSTLNSLYQLSMPGWVKARGMSFYLVVFQGGGAAGSAALGILAGHNGVPLTLLASAIVLALSPALGLIFRLKEMPPEELRPASDWPEPAVLGADEPPGPIMVSVEYRSEDHVNEVISALEEARFSRRRTGATSWRIWQDVSDPSRVVEQFTVASWEEHLRQHERLTVRDKNRLDKIRSFTDPARPPVLTHWLAPQPAASPRRRLFRN